MTQNHKYKVSMNDAADDLDKLIEHPARRSGRHREMNGLQVADVAQRAGIELKKERSEKVFELKVRGRTGEILALEARPGSIDINKYSVNHPVYDLYNKNFAMSVKTKSLNEDGSVRVRDYAHDLRNAIGAIPPKNKGLVRGLRGIDLTADRLMKIKRDNPERWNKIKTRLPKGITDAKTVVEITQILQDNAQLLIPSDQVLPTRKYVKRVATRNPSVYGLPDNLSRDKLQERVRKLVSRIQPIAPDITCDLINEYVKKVAKLRQNKG